MSMLELLIQPLLKEKPEPEPPKVDPFKEPHYDWIPDALEFVKKEGCEVTTLQIYNHVAARGKVPNRQSMSNTLTRVIKKGRAPKLKMRLWTSDRGFYKVNFWSWKNDTD